MTRDALELELNGLDQEQNLGFLRDIFAAHAVRKEKAENELKAVQAEFESLKAGVERQIKQLQEQAQQDEANFQRRKADLERQIEAKRQQKAQEIEAKRQQKAQETQSVQKSSSGVNTEIKTEPSPKTTSDTKKSNTMLWVGLGLGAVALIGLGLFAFRKKTSKE
ncbi:MAG: hypothetical protein RMJ97_06945 [Raineya sp.]|nr:hypothetical protein [Raineya sp.]MDW8296606.1 hypothetical protein [Raineya sp.]